MKGYSGPDFSTLDERIQNAISEYLEGFGVNEHMSAFIECMSLDKDQRLYMAWLGNLKDFVSNEWICLGRSLEHPHEPWRQYW